MRQINYFTAPLRFSDHRPVYATFQCTINVVDEVLKEQISHDLYEKRRSDVGNTTANSKLVDTDDEDLIGYDSIAPGLPPASSDRRKWWLDNGGFVRVFPIDMADLKQDSQLERLSKRPERTTSQIRNVAPIRSPLPLSRSG